MVVPQIYGALPRTNESLLLAHCASFLHQHGNCCLQSGLVPKYCLSQEMVFDEQEAHKFSFTSNGPWIDVLIGPWQLLLLRCMVFAIELKLTVSTWICLRASAPEPFSKKQPPACRRFRFGEPALLHHETNAKLAARQRAEKPRPQSQHLLRQSSVIMSTATDTQSQLL